MSTPILMAEPTPIPIPECGCPQCGEPLARGRLDLGAGQTVETVFCPSGNCDLRPFIFREQPRG